MSGCKKPCPVQLEQDVPRAEQPPLPALGLQVALEPPLYVRCHQTPSGPTSRSPGLSCSARCQAAWEPQHRLRFRPHGLACPRGPGHSPRGHPGLGPLRVKRDSFEVREITLESKRKEKRERRREHGETETKTMRREEETGRQGQEGDGREKYESERERKRASKMGGSEREEKMRRKRKK